MYIDGLTYSLQHPGAPEDLGVLWTDLESRADCSFFLTWDWIGTWLTTTSRLSPLLLIVRDGVAVVGLALLQPARRRNFACAKALYLHQTGDPATDIITIEYNGILCDRAHELAISRGAYKFLAHAALPQRPLTPEIHVALATDTIAREARSAGLLSFVLAWKRSWFVDLQAIRSSSRPYLETIGRNTRYQIRRSIRLYERYGPIMAVPAQTRTDAMTYLDELKVYHQRTWEKRGKSGSFASDYFDEFHRSLIDRCLERGRIELLRITAGNRLIGLLYNFMYRGHVYAYQTGLCYERDQRLKPGLVCHYICLERHIRSGELVYDFMAGDNRYKANLGIPGPILFHHVFQRPTIVSWSKLLIHELNEKIFGAPLPNITSSKAGIFRFDAW